MLATEEFAEWSEKVVLFLHNTSRCDDEPYPNLLKEKGGNSFPTVSFLDAGGRLLKQVGHVVTVGEMEAAYRELQEWRELRARVDGGDRSVANRLLRLELKNGMLPHAEARAAFEQLELDDDERAELEQQLVNLEFREILAATPQDEMAAGGEKFHAMYRAGRIPTSSQETSFWQYIFAYAGSQRDVKLFERVLADLKERKADDRRLRRYLPEIERQLEQLRRAVRR